MISPCKHCLLVPVCRNKLLAEIRRECPPVKEFMEGRPVVSPNPNEIEAYCSRVSVVIKDLGTTKFSLIKTPKGRSLRQTIKPKFRGKKYVTM
jgi:hypothetical protein